LAAGRLDVGIYADDDGSVVDSGFGGLVALGAGDRERLAGGRRTRGIQRDFDVEDVVLDGGFHGMVVVMVVDIYGLVFGGLIWGRR
jgi:F0F1-type ATP synthase membrane subunit c/vacuolar-type H+-ATPase subunit K